MQQETAYLAALVKAVAYQFNGDKLELRNAAGGLIASFAAPQPVAPTAKAPALTVTPTVTSAAKAAATTVTPTVAPAAKAAATTATPTVAPAAKAATTTAPAAGAGLTGTTWKWVRFVDSFSANDITTPDKYTIQFSADGKVTVVADCNQASGTYKIEGSKLSVMLSSMTKAACPAGSLSDKFVGNFALTTLYFLDGDNLFVQLFADSGILKFAKGTPAK